MTDDEEVSRLRNIASSVIADLFNGASIHDFRTVIGATHTNLIFDIALPFENKLSDNDVLEAVDQKIKEYDPNYYCVVTIDRQ